MAGRGNQGSPGSPQERELPPRSSFGPSTEGIPEHPRQRPGASTRPTNNCAAAAGGFLLWDIALQRALFSMTVRHTQDGRGSGPLARRAASSRRQEPKPRDTFNVELYIRGIMWRTDLCGVSFGKARKQRLAGLVAPHKNQRDSRNAST